MLGLAKREPQAGKVGQINNITMELGQLGFQQWQEI